MIKLATILLIVGGLNWGLMGFFQYDLVAAIFGGQAALMSRVIYSLVGISALYEIFAFSKIRRAELTSTDVPIRTDRAA